MDTGSLGQAVLRHIGYFGYLFGLLLLVAFVGFNSFPKTWQWNQKLKGDFDLGSLPCDRSIIYREGQPEIPRDYPVEQRIGQYRFFIPWAYLLGRPNPWRLNCPQRFDWTSIAFWIPDLQAPERDLSTQAFRPPMESNRPVPGPDAWVLRIMRLGPMRNEDTSILEKVANSRKYIWNGQAETSDATLTHAGTDHWYRIGPEDDVYIQCLPQNDCDLFLDLKDLRLRIFALYARQGVHQIDLVVAGLRKLLADWQIEK